QHELIGKLRSFGAHVEELTPVGMVALFGLQPMEDPASRAAHAALAMLKALEREEAHSVGARFAIHSGRCLIAQGTDVAAMDDTDRRDVRTVLDALIQGAAPNTIVVDQAAATFLRRRFDLEATGVARVSGTTYRVMRPGRSGFEVGARGLSPFVGRDQ